jgi:hypothetical protein
MLDKARQRALESALWLSYKAWARLPITTEHPLPTTTKCSLEFRPPSVRKRLGLYPEPFGFLFMVCEISFLEPLAIARKWENLWAALCLHFAYFNFCRIHKSLRVTPAMQAGITDRVWDIADC